MAFSPELQAAPKVDRYRIEAFIGKGATSLVYRAFDIENNFHVALKSIRYPDQDGIYRIKQEFRSLFELIHPNIVELYDLYVDDDFCFYTMELIAGQNFVHFVRERPELLRYCLAQLVEALGAVHDSGRLHRDLKPGNIMIEPTGRTVLLDFGLAVETRPLDSILTQGQLYGGTPAYMAPELLDGEPPSVASDLYALGVILYESLAGRRPFANLSPLARQMAARESLAPPTAFASDAPEDLSELALGLMAFDPDSRTRLPEVRRRLLGSAVAPIGRESPEGRAPPFIDRTEALAAMKIALDDTLAGRQVVVQVSGASGVGKSALLERFLAEARAKMGAQVLRSRCHHRESVRYNAVDGLIDMLSRQLVGESEQRLAAIAPRHLGSLLMMFPVLSRIAWPQMDAEDEPTFADSTGLVKQAVEALGQLLREISAGRPLLLWIDDLQWSDSGSLPLLARILGGGGPILTILSYRSEDVRPENVAATIEGGGAANEAVEIRHIFVGPLSEPYVAQLLRTLGGEEAASSPGRIQDALQLSAGLPFFVLQFAIEAASPAGMAELSAAPANQGEMSGGDRLLARRLQRLTPPQRAMLEIVATAGRPIADTALIRIATGDAASGREIYQLLNQKLLRKAEVAGKGAVETYHDRIRSAILEAMPPARKQALHLAIAEEFERADDLDHPALVEHYLAANELRRALENAKRAARAAKDRLAFPQAVDFLRLAARLAETSAEKVALEIELAEALADAGRSSEAADLFLRAAEAHGRDPRAASALEAKAARHLLFSGRLGEARALHRKLFTDFGVAFPETVGAAMRKSLVNRALFALRLAVPAGARLRRSREFDTARLDSLWAAAIGFLMTDFVVGDALLTRFMREAAALGEPSRLLRAILLEASSMANLGWSSTLRRADRLLLRAKTLSRRSSDPYDDVVLQTCAMSVVFLRGRFAEAAELARLAVEKHRRECVRYDFVASIAQSYRIAALALAGEIRTLRADAKESIEDAEARGDVYIARSFRSGYFVYGALADDDPVGVIADSQAVIADLPSDRFTSQHWLHFVATTNAFVYAGKPWEAWALVERQWPSIRAAGFLRLALIGAHLIEYRARVALSCAAAGSPPERFAACTRARLLKLASADAKAIARRLALSHARASAAAIRAAVAAQQGDTAQQARELRAARDGFVSAGMSLHANAAELQLALVSDQASRAAALTYFEREGVKNPERLAALLMFAL